MSTTAYLALETGEVFRARCRSPGTTNGEIVFTTPYTGYEESITDPSYAKQILTFAYPLIGNYGVNEARFESDSVQPTAIVARELTNDVSTWLDNSDTPAIDKIDTRQLVLRIREEGAMKCGIAAGPDATKEDAIDELEASDDMADITNIGEMVSTPTAKIHKPDNPTGTTVALVDCGVKHSIIDSFVERGATVHQLPHDTPVEEVLDRNPDIVFISNGPGDPTTFTNALHVAETVKGDLPLAGICLGQQIIALADGGTTEKMLFGHRGVNHPVLDHASGQVMMTTQNHGYGVEDPGDLTVTQTNVNDDSIEGLDDPDRRILTRQYHPEANPGPRDVMGFFDDVIAMSNGETSSQSQRLTEPATAP